MNPAVEQDKIDAISGRLPAYKALQAHYKELQDRVSVAVDEKARHALLPSMEKAAQRIVRFEKMLRVLYVYTRRMEMRERGMEGLTGAFEAGAFGEIEERLREQPLTAEGWVVVGLITAMGEDPDRFGSVRACFGEALQLRRGIDIYCDYGWLLLEHGGEEDSNTLFEEAAQLAGQDGYEASVSIDPVRVVVDAEILCALGAAFGRLENYRASRWAFGYAVRLFDSFAIIDPTRYLPGLAAALHRQGNMLREKKDYAEGEAVYNRSIEMFRKLAQSKPHLYEPILAKVIRSLGRLQYRSEDKDKFCNTLYYAVTIYERLADVSAIYEGELSATYRNLGSALFEQKDEGGARLVWEKALPLQERLAEANPKKYERDYLGSLQGLGTVYEHKGELGQAEAILKKALALKDRNRAVNPDQYVAEKGRVLRLLGRQYMNSQQLRLAEEVFEEALDLYEEQVAKGGERLDAKRIEVLSGLVEIYHQTGGEEPGIEIMKRQVFVYEKLAGIDGEKYNRGYIGVMTRLASEYADSDDHEAAKALRVKAEGILSVLSAVAAMRDVKAHVHEGEAAASGERTGGGASGSPADWSKTIDWNTAISGRGDDAEGVVDWRAERAENLFWLAILLEQEGDDVHTGKIYEDCVEVYEVLAREDARKYKPKLANALMYHGRYLQRRGEAGSGQRLIDRAIALEHDIELGVGS